MRTKEGDTLSTSAQRKRKRLGCTKHHQRLADTLADAGNLEASDGAEGEGAEFVAIAREARGRVEGGSVWSLAGDLRALGVEVGDDVEGLLVRVVAHHISEQSQDARAIRYDRNAPRMTSEEREEFERVA